MKVGFLFRQIQPKTFKLSYSPDYKTFITHHVLNDPQHPLYEQRKREHEKREEKGLWWHVTSPVDLSKSSVVRNWCRRRLRNAILKGLTERGFDEDGKLVKEEALARKWGTLAELLKEPKDFRLKGSLRFHVQAPLIPANFADVKQETAKVLDALLEGAATEMLGIGQKDPRAKVASSQWGMLATSRAPKLSGTSQKRRKKRSEFLKPI